MGHIQTNEERKKMERIQKVLELIKHDHELHHQIINEMGLMRIPKVNALGFKGIGNAVTWGIEHEYEQYEIVDVQIINDHLVFSAQTYDEDCSVNNRLFSLTLEGDVENSVAEHDRLHMEYTFDADILSITKIKTLNRIVTDKIKV